MVSLKVVFQPQCLLRHARRSIGRAVRSLIVGVIYMFISVILLGNHDNF